MLGVGLVFGCWFGVLGLGFGVWGIGCWVLGFGLGAWMSGLRGYGVLRRSHMAVHIHMQALSVPPLRLCYAFNPLGLDGGFLKRGGGVTEKENNGIWDMQNKATLSQIQAPTLNIGGGRSNGKNNGLHAAGKGSWGGTFKPSPA